MPVALGGRRGSETRVVKLIWDQYLCDFRIDSVKVWNSKYLETVIPGTVRGTETGDGDSSTGHDWHLDVWSSTVLMRKRS